MATARAEDVLECERVWIEPLLVEDSVDIDDESVSPICHKECSVSCFDVEHEEEYPFEHCTGDCWICEHDLRIEDEFVVKDAELREETATDGMPLKWIRPSNVSDVNGISTVPMPRNDELVHALLPVVKHTETYLQCEHSKRVDRGGPFLRSKSNVPAAYDNRYHNITETVSTKSSQKNCLILDNFTKAPFSKASEKKKSDTFGNLQENEYTVQSNRRFYDEHSQTQRTPESNLQELTIMQRVKQNHYQFYNEIITYPTSTEACARDDCQKQPVRGVKNWELEKKPIYSKESTERSESIVVEDTEDFDDLDDVPSYDEIPYALILSGGIDEKCILRAKRKQMQQKLFDDIKQQSNKSQKFGETMQSERQNHFEVKDKNQIMGEKHNLQCQNYNDGDTAMLLEKRSTETIEKEREPKTSNHCLNEEQSCAKNATKVTDPEPTVMNLLRRGQGQEQIKQQPESREYKTQQDTDFTSKLQPIAMRILQKTKEYKKKTESAQYGSFSKYRRDDPVLNDASPFYGALDDVFKNMFRKKSGDLANSPKNMNKLTDMGSPSLQRKNEKTSNKNQFPKKGNREEQYGRPSSKEQMKEPTNKENRNYTKEQRGSSVHAQSSDVKYKKFHIDFDDAVNNSTDELHLAFQLLKQSKFKIKCASCGRPECINNYGKKMTEIIEVSKQVGFEVYDVSSDGNCMFTAVVDQLQIRGDNSFNPRSLREAAVSWLIENPYNSDGTPFASFVSGNWDVYLRKMIAEGEWGDHLTLRAVVEVLGVIIKVLSVTNGDANWTILKPTTTEESKHGMGLVLGHIAEFHYTSLRPTTDENPTLHQSSAGQDKPVHVRNEAASIDTSIVEMFRGDYMDHLNDMPSAHFSYLLKNVVPTKIVDSAAIFQSQHVDSFSNPELYTVNDTLLGIPIKLDIELGGNIAEGLYVYQFEKPIAGHTTVSGNVTTYVYSVMKDYIVTDQSSGNKLEHDKFICVLDTFGVHTGYTRLKLLNCQRMRSNWIPQIFVQDDTRPYLCRKDCTMTHIHMKQVLSIQCKIWPECAQSWRTRKRLEGWPPKDIITAIESEGCILVPAAHRDSENPFFEWQFSFSLCERRLFKDAVTSCQKYCFIVFEAMFTQTINSMKFITSDRLKSVFFYACERIPEQYWESCPSACLMYMLDMLFCCIKERNLPNYFVNGSNMIDDIHVDDLTDIEEKITIIRSQPVLFLQQVNDSLGMLPNGATIIDRIVKDIEKFKQHRSLRRSTLVSFIPATLQTARHYISTRLFGQAYELLSQAFHDRLSVSTCYDYITFQAFLPTGIIGLDLDSLVWFSAYIDRQLEGQLSKSLIREICGDLALVKVNDILPADVVESYGNTEVPAKFSEKPCWFCNEYAKFLYQTNKFSEILPVLYYCHDIFTKLEDNKRNKNDGTRNKERLRRNDFTDESMFNIYTAMFVVYKKQHQLEFFRHVKPVVEGIVRRKNTRGAYSCLCYINQDMADYNALDNSAIRYGMLPFDKQEHEFVNAFLYWPIKMMRYL